MPLERTPLPVPVNERLAKLEFHVDKAVGSVEKLAESVNSLVEVVHGAPSKPEDGMLWKVIKHEHRRRTWDKIAIAVLTAICIGLIGFLVRISWMVQSSRGGP